MKIRMMILGLTLIGVTLSYADPLPTVKTPLTDPQAEQVEALQAATQAQVDAVTLQLDAAGPAERESLERRIVELKRQGEIERLTLLLSAAQAEGEAARIAEIQAALAQWTHPPETQILPTAATTKPASAPDAARKEPASPTTSAK